jgi:CheY-like chemotaxis protein
MTARETPLPVADVVMPRAPRVLVIDDDRHVRMLLDDLLAAWGYEADFAADGVEGLALFEQGTYDVVLTDLTMPRVTGLDVVAGVRSRDPSVAVIMFTAFMGELQGEDERLGFTVLRKPLNIEGLRRALRETLAGSASA